MKKNRLSWWGKIVVLVAAVSLFLLWYIFWGLSAGQPGSAYNKEHNAIWIGHQWVGESKTAGEIQQLVNDLRKYQIDTVFVHAGPLEANGYVSADRFDYAARFLNIARSFDDDIEYQAWLGQLRGELDLDNPEYRANIARISMIMTKFVGFDGIHFDIEPIWDEDEGFIQMLDEVRMKIPEEKKISVAVAKFIPRSVVWMTEKSHGLKNYNTEVNYQNIAKHADQIVAMVYDTGIPYEWAYRWLVREQTIWLTDLLVGTEVFIGIPAYEDETKDSSFEVENIENGLLGVVNGLNNVRSREENFAGVAIYPYWSMDSNKWDQYEKLWLK